MKQIIVMFFVLSMTVSAAAQDFFQKELYTAEVVLKYRVEIGLTNEQVEQVKQIYADHITNFNSKKWDLDAELVALDKSLALTRVNEKESLAQMDKIMMLEDELKRIKLGMLIKIKNELNESQQEQLKRLRTEKDLVSEGITTPINENPRIVLRSTSGFKGSTPLIIIKDKKGERRNLSFDNINPDHIKMVEVLKDEAAIKAYGAEGKNGVVIITMKD